MEVEERMCFVEERMVLCGGKDVLCGGGREDDDTIIYKDTTREDGERKP